MYTYIGIKIYEAFAIHVDLIKFPHYKKIQSKSMRTYLYHKFLAFLTYEIRFHPLDPNISRVYIPVFSGVFLAVKNIIN